MVINRFATRASAAFAFGALLASATGLGDSFAAEGPFISEARLGAAYHDSGPFSHSKEKGADINAEVLFRDLHWLKRWNAEVRPHFGLSANTSGDTSQLYAGLTATFHLGERFFVEGSVGGSAHDGKHHSDDPHRKELGCTVLFRESAAFGINVTEHSNFEVYLDHISNANICSKNEGLETLGVRYGYRF